MIEKEILQALQTATLAAVAASTMPTLKIKVKGRTFEIPNSQEWLEIISIPNNIDNEFWGDGKTYRGLFRLLLHWPLKEEGAYPPLAVLASIGAYFAKGKVFQNGSVSVRIYDKPDLTGMIEAPPEQIFPLTIKYMCFDKP